MRSDSLLKLFWATRGWLLLLQGWAWIFVTSSCSICHLWMRVIHVLGWRQTPFFLYFSDGTFWIFYYFSDLTISLPSERESRRVDSFTLNDQGAHPFLHTHARRQADVCINHLSLSRQMCLCASCTIIPFGGAMMRRQVPSFRFFFYYLFVLHWLRELNQSCLLS